ncbi:MAG: hypothetical protein ACI35P_10130 [Bacillus sp. (in: firmicutes)]
MFKIKKYFFMSAKRPRPAVPVLVHVDNPTEATSVVVDTSTIEGKMDTVITNQERIYNKIPSGTSGSGADLTTVNENTTNLVESIGPPTSITSDNNIFGAVKNIRNAIGDYHVVDGLSGTTVKSRLRNIQTSIGDASSETSETDSTVKGYLLSLKNSMGPTINSSTISTPTVRGLLINLRNAVGDSTGTPISSQYSVRGILTNLRDAIGDSNDVISATDTKLRSLAINIRNSIGNSTVEPTDTGTSIRDLLTAIKANTASGGGGGGGSADLTTVNEKITAINTAVGSSTDTEETASIIGLLKSITNKY